MPAVLTVKGFVVSLPNNVQVCFEIAKDDRDLVVIGLRVRVYVHTTAIQGLIQTTLIAIMARFATGC